jgi:sugar phosphate isomerase/epimerase
VSAGFITRQGLIDPEPARRQEISVLLERVLEACQAAGGGVLHLPCHGASEPRSAGERQLLLEVLRPLVQKAAALDVRLALDALEPADVCRDWVNALHGPPVGVAYDTGNARAAGQELAADLQLLGSALYQVRLRDRSKREPFPSVTLGAGQVDFGAVLKALVELRYEGWLIPEAPSGDAPAEAARRSLQFLSTLAVPLPG